MPASPRVEIHHDFAVLERRLEGLLRSLRREHGPLAPAAVVVPTARLRAHLQERLASRCGTLLGIRVFHHDSLAAEAAADAAAAGSRSTPLRPLGDAAREAILAEAATRAGGAIARWLGTVPAGAGSLLAPLDDLREAGIDPVAARRVAGLSDEARALLDVSAEYDATLARLREAGFADRAGRMAAILGHLPRFVRRFRLLVHYGAYELVGMNLDLMRAAHASGVPAVWLAPGHPTAPAFAYARSFWREAFGVEPIVLDERDAAAAAGRGEPEDDRLLASSLPSLYDEERTGGGVDVGFFHAQGCSGELQEAALVALRDHEARGTPPHRIGVLARSLEPYADGFAELARRDAVPLTTSAMMPVRTGAAAQAALHLMRTVLLDFPAQPLLELVRSGLLVPPGRTDPPSAVDSWERLLRHYGVPGGREFLTHRLLHRVDLSPPPAVRRPPEERDEEQRLRRALAVDVLHLAALVRALDEEAAVLRHARDWRAFAAAARALLEARLTPFAPDAAEDAAGSAVLGALADFDALHAAGVRFESPAAALLALERALARARAPLAALGPGGDVRERDEGGLRVFDVMQARGLSFDTVVLVGMNAGRFPRPARPDPFLADDDRRRLRAATGRPLPIKEDSRLEEHLLLALALGSAQRRLVVGWQRADDEGRALSPSLALREIARVTRGAPDLEAIARTARRVSGDPRQGAADAVREHGILPPGEALVAAALEAGSPQAFLERLPALGPVASGGVDLSAGLGFLAAIESPEDRGFDALVGPSGGAARWSPSRLELFGACPQLYFFQHRLHIGEWGDPPALHALDPREIGGAVHLTLARVYATAARRHDTAGAIAARGLDDAESIAGLVRAEWERSTRWIALRLEDRYPGLWEPIGGAWREALVRFVERDVPTLLALGEPWECEEEIDASLALPGRDEPVRLHGRLDRVRRTPDGLVVSDYKTGGQPGMFVRPVEILKGRRLQMPLYALMAETSAWEHRQELAGAAGEGRVTAEVLGVGPRHERAPEEARALLEPATLAPIREGLLETLAVLMRLFDAGLHPLNESSEHCDFCPYRRACRRTHGPTLDRLRSRPDLRDYILLRSKNGRAPLLAQVRGVANGEDE